MTEALEHITITSGASRRSPRTEVSNEIVGALRADIAARRRLIGSPWAVSLHQTPEGGHVFDLTYNGMAAARCWLCLHSHISNSMWTSALTGRLDPEVLIRQPKSTPWLAAALLPAAISLGLISPVVLMELGDLERCVAWALIE